MHTREHIETLIADAQGNVVEYHKSGDGLDSYDFIFVDDWSTACISDPTARLWLESALYDSDYYGEPLDLDAIRVYKRWLETRQSAGDVAEPVYSDCRYMASRDCITGYALPEYWQIADYDQCKPYPRLMQWIENNRHLEATYCDTCGLQVCLDGAIEYRPTKQHKRAARLIVALFNGE